MKAQSEDYTLEAFTYSQITFKQCQTPVRLRVDLCNNRSKVSSKYLTAKGCKSQKTYQYIRLGQLSEQIDFFSSNSKKCLASESSSRRFKVARLHGKTSEQKVARCKQSVSQKIQVSN